MPLSLKSEEFFQRFLSVYISPEKEQQAQTILANLFVKVNTEQELTSDKIDDYATQLGCLAREGQKSNLQNEFRKLFTILNT